MSSVRQLILDNLVSNLETISTANNYNTNIRKVVSGRILPTEKLRPDWRAAACQVRYDGQTNDKADELADSHGLSATARYICFASMANATHTQFMNFLDDVEAAISKDPSRGDLNNSAYKVLDTWIADITLIDVEETDEIFDLGESKDFEAVLEIVVEYLYVPDLLSGV